MIFRIFLVLFTSALFISCPSPGSSSNQAAPTPTLTLILTAPKDGNTLTAAVNGVTQASPVKVSQGETITLTAAAAEDFLFTGWNGDAGGKENPLKLVMDSDKTVGALFNPVVLGHESENYTYDLLGDHAVLTDFDGAATPQSLEIPESVSLGEAVYRITVIKEEAFRDIGSLQEVIVPASLVKIETAAFRNTSLSSITLLGNTTNIEAEVFTDTSLDSLAAFGIEGIHPAGTYSFITAVSENSIRYQLYDIPDTHSATATLSTPTAAVLEFPETITYQGTEYSVNAIFHRSFNRISASSLIIPASVAWIGETAFHNSSSLTSVEFKGDNTRLLSHNIFLGTPLNVIGTLRTADTPGSGTYSIQVVPDASSYSPEGYRYSLFQDQENREAVILAYNPALTTTELSIPGTVEHGGKTYTVVALWVNSFKNNAVIESLTLPASLTVIKPNAFGNCTSLTSVTIEGDGTFLTTNSFWSTSFSAMPNFENTTPARGTYSFIFNQTIGDYTCNLYDANGSYTAIITAYDSAAPPAVLTIPDSINFNSRDYTVTSLTPRLYKDQSSFEEVTIPASIRDLGYELFEGCSNLTAVTFLGDYTTQMSFIDFLNTPLADHPDLNEPDSFSPAAGTYRRLGEDYTYTPLPSS